MSDFDGTVQRPAGPEDTDGSGPVGMSDVWTGTTTPSAERAVGLEDAAPAGQPSLQADSPPTDAGHEANVVGEETGLTEAQVLGREPLPDYEP